MKKLLPLLFVTLCNFHFKTYAWGKQGHSIIAAIAKSQLDSAVIKKVDSYLMGLSWEETACWMDGLKTTGNAEYMKEWHYINIPRDKTYVKGKTLNVVNQLEYFIKILKNHMMHPPATITEALRMVFHLTGDIAQPLHCGYNDDKGGTRCNLRFLDRVTNLHSVWDSEIAEEKKIDLWRCSKYMMSLSPEEKIRIQKVDVLAWLNDSRLLLKEVYAFQDGYIDKKYIEKNALVVEQQFVKAGLRLAAILNANFRD